MPFNFSISFTSDGDWKFVSFFHSHGWAFNGFSSFHTVWCSQFNHKMKNNIFSLLFLMTFYIVTLIQKKRAYHKTLSSSLQAHVFPFYFYNCTITTIIIIIIILTTARRKENQTTTATIEWNQTKQQSEFNSCESINWLTTSDKDNNM